jgi:hypothetical protein
MRIVYSAENQIDAQLVMDELNHHGIEPMISGENLLSGVGELPFGGLVKVWVADEVFDQARALVVNWEQRLRNGEFVLDDIDDELPNNGQDLIGKAYL